MSGEVPVGVGCDGRCHELGQDDCVLCNGVDFLLVCDDCLAYAASDA